MTPTRAALGVAALVSVAGCTSVIHGRVFVDLDGDRVRDAGEPGVPDVAVFFERAVRARADAAGDYVLVTPYPFGMVWAWTPDGFRPGPSFARAVDDEVAVDIPVAPRANPSAAAPSAAAPWTFAVGSDSHVLLPQPDQRWDGGDLAAAVRAMVAPAPAPPVFFTILGDVTQNGHDDQFDAAARALAGIATPFVPVVGNHDIYDGGVAWQRHVGPDGYAFDAGGLRFVVWHAFLPDADQLAFFHLVLDGEDPAARIVGLGHTSPRDPVAAQMAALGVDVLLTGHWHANRRVDRFGLVEWSTEPLIMGGLDHTPAGYRVVTVDAGRVTTTARRTLRAPAVGIAAPTCTGAGPVDVIAVAALDAGTPVVTAAWADATGAPAALVGAGGWAYRGQVAPAGDRTRTLVVVATSRGGVRGEARARLAPCRAGVSIGASAGTWPQIQGGADHRGASDAHVAGLARGWTATVGGHVLGGSPIVAGDTAYVTVTDLADGDAGGVVALALSTGRERWRVTTAHPARSAVAVGSDRVVIADSGGLVRAVDARTGREAWRRDLTPGTESWTWHLWQPPTIAGDTVFIGTQARLVALDLATGAERWARTFTRQWPWLGTTAAATVVGDNVLFVRDREDGLLLVSRATGADVAAAVTGDTLGVAGAPVVTADAIVIGNSRGEVVALDPATLEPRWRTALVPGGGDWSESIVGNLAVAGGRVFAPTQGGELVALDAATGAVQWRQRTAAGPINTVHYGSDGLGYSASPVVTGDLVWLGGPDGKLRAFTVATGAVVEQHALGAPILAGIAPVDGGVVVATFAGTVQLLAIPRAAPVFPWIVFPGGLVVFLAIAGLLRRLRG